MSNALNLSVEKSGIANLVFDLPNEKINKLSAPVLLELEKILGEIANNQEIKILIISSAKQNIFIAGADINEIKNLKTIEDTKEKVSSGQKILDKIAQLKIPTIALIKGACLGGGLELALACKYRIAIVDDKTSLGLPEVNLGIIPGFGGTQRLPKLIGLQESLKIILSGKAVDAKKAFKIGLVDEISREEFLDEKLNNFISKILQNSKKNEFIQKRKKAERKRFYFEQLLAGKYLIYYITHQDLVAKTKNQYPAPFYALEVIKRTYDKKISKGLEVELEAFCEIAVGQISKNLIDIFFISEELKKESFISEQVQAKEIKNAACLGAGIMGGGIAWLFSYKDIFVRIKDISQHSIALGYQQIFKIYNQLKKIRKLTAEEINIKIDRVTSGLDYTGFKDADIIVEAIVENMEIKKSALAELENHVREDAIIVSNTSSLSINEMAKALKNPQRFAGFHFFNPVNRMPLVEIIPSTKTSDETIYSLVALARKLGKTPIVVKDVAGFLVNRILLPYINEASYLYQEGANIRKIDELIENFGMPMGPFYLADIVGIDVGAKVAHILHESYGERMEVSQILHEISKDKNITGQKSGFGFYVHDKFNKEQRKLNRKIDDILYDLDLPKVKTPSDEDIIDRCILTMINEAAKCLEEDVVKNARYLDMAMVMGAGFPIFHGGLCKYADTVGISEIVKKLHKFEMQIGERFKVSQLLQDMAKNNRKFYE